MERREGRECLGRKREAIKSEEGKVPVKKWLLGQCLEWKLSEGFGGGDGDR